jgi:methionyl-tRNA synthetase
MLFADIIARFYRLGGESVFYLCGADEHGARTEYVARGYGTTPKQLLDAKFDATVPLLKKLNISLDYFGRTHDSFHIEFVQNLIEELIQKEVIIPGTQKIAWCSQCSQHLPDRFLEGTCPYCQGRTYGNQCNNKKDCARLVESDQVIDGRCAVCSAPVSWKEENHLFLRMELFKEQITNLATSTDENIAEVSRRIQRTILENPKVCITRDTQWGIPIPRLPGKSIYSWVDSLLAKVSMLAKQGPETEASYWKNTDTQHHFFLGMDGTPFYGALLPALLLATQRGYAIDHWHLLPNEVFIYEGGICSKSTGTGIWLEEALASVPADFWRFYIFFVHSNVEMGAERDVDFRWERFCEAINFWLIRGLKLAAEAPERKDDDRVATQVYNQAQALIRSKSIGKAFRLILDALVENPSRNKTQKLAGLLGCFLPDTGEALAKGRIPFKIAPLYSPQVQMDYQDLVDARRAKRGLNQEITDARADVLCVCPINLKEQ